MKDLISVIVPVYRAETYLQACVDSVLSQSYENIELILVDDGSPDNCPVICDCYAEKDSRVRVVHKSNGGASSARNAGLAIAKGTYITFIDSDDIMVADGLIHLQHAMKRTNAMFCAGVCQIMNSTSCKNRIDSESYIDFEKNPQKVLLYITQSGSYSPYAKMYLGDLIRKHNLCFDESLKCSEDALFVRQYLLHCSNMVMIPHVVYKYNTTNTESLSKKGYESFCEYYLEKIKVLEQFCAKLPIDEQEKRCFLSYRAVHGLRICANHYIEHWSRTDEQFNLIQKSVILLSPWVDVSDASLAGMDIVTAEWWKTKRKFIESSNIESYFNRITTEAKKARRKHLLVKIKRKIKKWIKK